LACPHPTIARTAGGVCPICPLAKQAKALPERFKRPKPVKAHTPSLADIKEQQRRRRAKRASDSFAEFVRQAWDHCSLSRSTRLRWNWHIKDVCDHIQAVIEELLKAKADENYIQKVRDFVVNVPPRSLKSILVSVMLPAWVWGPKQSPEISFRCLSSSEKLVLEHARASRDLMRTEWYIRTFDVKWHWDPEKNAAGLFYNSEGGFRASQPWLSSITGSGSDVMIFDDPHDVNDAGSEVKREAVINKYKESMCNRVNDPTRYAKIGIMQRVHELDWTGYILTEEQGWQHLRIPQEYELPSEKEEYARTTWLGWSDPRKEAGELLFSEWFPPDWVAKEKVRLGSYQYAGQHQQRPAPAEGGMFKKAWFRSFELDDMPRLDELILSLDPAAKKTEIGSNYAWVLVGKRDDTYYIIHVDYGRMEFDEALKLSIEICKAYQPRKFLIEPKAAGPALVRMLVVSKELRVPIIEIEPQGDKVQRAQACLPVFEAGNVLLKKGAPWRDAYIGELCTFPVGAQDDMVDATTQAINHMVPDDWHTRWRQWGNR